MSAIAERPRVTTTQRQERISESELARLRRKVDGGSTLTDSEASALLAEMERATAATKPTTATLQNAVDIAREQRGRELSYVEVEVLWGTIPGLRAVKHMHDRERARWRRANGILRESNILQRGEAVPVNRRAPHPVEPAVPQELDRRRPSRRRRFPR